MASSTVGRPLKSFATLNDKMLTTLTDSITNSISTGGVTFNNINIQGGTINGVTTGNNNPGIGVFTVITSGNPNGLGYSVCFYGAATGDSACWVPKLGQWNIQGDLLVRDIADLGHLRIDSNTLSSTNTNGNIILDPNGTGTISLSGPLTQNTTSGNITFNTNSGLYTLATSTSITSTAGTTQNILTNNGDITLRTGLNVSSKIISFITTGSNPTITTTSAHTLLVGDTITISGSSSIPNIDGEHIVLIVPTTTTFTIQPTVPVTVIGMTGSVVKHNDINLTATNNINIPSDIPLNLGNNTSITGNTNLDIISVGDINLNAIAINIPNDVPLNLGTSSFTANTANLILDTDKLIINGDLEVNGDATKIYSTITVVQDPVLSIGGDTPPTIQDTKSRGIEARWNNGITALDSFFGIDTSTGCFTYIPDATNVSDTFTGTPGCAKFGDLTVNSININGGNISNVATLNTCNIVCSGTMNISAVTATNITTPLTTVSGNLTANGTTNTINGSNLNITATNVSITDPNIDIGTLTDTVDHGIIVNNNGQQNWYGIKDNGTFTTLTNITNTNNIITGTAGPAAFGNTTVNNLNIAGTLSGNLFTTEHLSSAGGGTINISGSVNISYIKVTTAGIVTGTLQNGSIDGYSKYIMIVALASGAEYHMSAVNNLLDPGSQSTTTKVIRFESTGQGVVLVWNNVDSMYMVMNGGACM